MPHVHVKSYDLIINVQTHQKMSMRYQCYYKYIAYTKLIRKPVIWQYNVFIYYPLLDTAAGVAVILALFGNVC